VPEKLAFGREEVGREEVERVPEQEPEWREREEDA